MLLRLKTVCIVIFRIQKCAKVLESCKNSPYRRYYCRSMRWRKAEMARRRFRFNHAIPVRDSSQDKREDSNIHTAKQTKR